MVFAVSSLVSLMVEKVFKLWETAFSRISIVFLRNIYSIWTHKFCVCVGEFCACVCNVVQALFSASLPMHLRDPGDEASSNCPVFLKHTCFNISHCKLLCPVEHHSQSSTSEPLLETG